jgi:hypothetical protein
MYRVGIFIFMLIYCAGVFGAARYYEQPLIYIAVAFILNFILALTCGNYLLRAVIFPYANYFIKRRLDATLN